MLHILTKITCIKVTILSELMQYSILLLEVSVVEMFKRTACISSSNSFNQDVQGVQMKIKTEWLIQTFTNNTSNCRLRQRKLGKEICEMYTIEKNVWLSFY